MSLLDEKKEEIMSLISRLPELLEGDTGVEEQDLLDALGEIEDHVDDVFFDVENAEDDDIDDDVDLGEDDLYPSEDPEED